MSIDTKAPVASVARRVLLAAAGVALVAQAAWAIGDIHLGGESVQRVLDGWVVACVLALAAVITAGRSFVRTATTTDRAAWLAAGLGLGAWAAATAVSTDVVWPAASFTRDAIGIAFYPALLTALVLLAVGRIRGLTLRLALDATVVGLVAGVLVGAVVSEQLAGADTTRFTSALVDLGFPMGSVLLAAGAVAIAALTGWRTGRQLGWLIISALAIALAGAIGVAQGHLEPWQVSPVLKTVFAGAGLAVAIAAWMPRARPQRVAEDSPRIAFFGSVLALAGLAVMVYDSATGDVPFAAVVVAAGGVAALVVRYGLTFAWSLDLLGATRRQRLFDALTGLGNRRKLIADLRRLTKKLPHGGPLVLALFELRGFQEYNETYGELAGDALLTRLGRHLSAAVRGSGEAYRVGGDEFGVLARVGRVGPDAIVTAATAGLSDYGEGFEIAAIAVPVLLPDDADDAGAAIRLAQQRLYARRLEAEPESTLQEKVLHGIEDREGSSASRWIAWRPPTSCARPASTSTGPATPMGSSAMRSHSGPGSCRSAEPSRR